MHIPTLVLMFDSPVQIALVVGVIFLIFGAGKLPQLAKSIGQTQKAFKDGLREAEEEEAESHKLANQAAPQISNISDDEIMAEMRRRAEVKQV